MTQRYIVVVAPGLKALQYILLLQLVCVHVSCFFYSYNNEVVLLIIGLVCVPQRDELELFLTMAISVYLCDKCKLE